MTAQVSNLLNIILFHTQQTNQIKVKFLLFPEVKCYTKSRYADYPLVIFLFDVRLFFFNGGGGVTPNFLIFYLKDYNACFLTKSHFKFVVLNTAKLILC